jgi:hypothetical protein
MKFKEKEESKLMDIDKLNNRNQQILKNLISAQTLVYIVIRLSHTTWLLQPTFGWN